MATFELKYTNDNEEAAVYSQETYETALNAVQGELKLRCVEVEGNEMRRGLDSEIPVCMENLVAPQVKPVVKTWCESIMDFLKLFAFIFVGFLICKALGIDSSD